MAKKVYAVRKGQQPGLYETWAECERQVKGFPGAEFKGFKSRNDALAWLGAITESPDDTQAEEEHQTSGGSPSEEYPRQASQVEYVPPWEISVEQKQQQMRGAGTDPCSSGVATRAVKNDSKQEEDLRDRRSAKAAAFVTFLERHGVEAHVTPSNSEHYHRIGLEQGGNADLYLTRKKPYELRLTGVNDSDRKQQLKRLWRMFHWEIGEGNHGAAVDGWKVVEHYYRLLKPFGHLNFDFLPLAHALEEVAVGAPPAEVVRYDFDRIERVYLELRPQSQR